MPALYNGQEIVFGLDIGTRSIVGTVGYKDARNRFQVVAQAERFHETRAMLDGQIHDIARVAETIVKVKDDLEKKLNITLTEVCIAAAGRVLKTAVGVCEESLEEEMPVDDELVYTLEMLGVEKANDQIVADNNTEIKFYCVGYTVIRYYLNGFPIGNLVGHKASKVGAEVLATFLPEDVVDGLYAAVGQAGLEVVNLTLEPIAAMNVAIPEQYRLLNIALVDVGAGTSDICITKDGSVAAYGMIPYAGDKLTEVLVQKYLIDFATAEKIKMMSPTKKSMQYKDIMGDKQKITRVQLEKDLMAQTKEMAKMVAEKIVELNGGKAVSAVFVVGGGGKVKGFTKALADALKIVPNRVALRGSEVMGSIDMLDETLKKDALYVTPIGICINYYEKKNNFVFVTVNDQRVKLYDNNKLTVMDAAATAGVSNDALFPKRGEDLTFSVNGKQRIIRGNRGEAAVIHINQKEVSMTTAIEANDKITITESTVGMPAVCEAGHLPEYHQEIHFRVNGQTITCPKYVMVNDELQSPYYNIQNNDQIVILDYYTVEQLLLFLDLPDSVSFYINHEPAGKEDKIFDNYMINWAENDQKLSEIEDEIQQKNNEGTSDISEYSATETEQEGQQQATSEDVEQSNTQSAQNNAYQDGRQNGNNADVEDDNRKQQIGDRSVELSITVNDELVVLKNKKEYTFVDILDFYPFDLSTMGGSTLVTQLNGVDVGFTEPLHEGDQAAIFWKE